MKKLPLIALTVLLVLSSHAQQLSETQQAELLDVGIEYVQKATEIESLMQGKLTELGIELTREGRLDSQDEADKSAKQANAILKDIGGLYGQFIKTKVELVLKAKNVLTLEQKLHLLAQLEPDEVMNYEEVEFLQPSIFDLPINLNLDQRKKLIGLEADLLIKEVKLERDVELILLDFEAALLADAIDPAKVDKQVMKLADLAAKAIENRVDYFIDAKDVLTLDQKRLLAFLMGLD